MSALKINVMSHVESIGMKHLNRLEARYTGGSFSQFVVNSYFKCPLASVFTATHEPPK